MLKNTIVVLVVLVALVVGAGSFYGGMVYGKSSSKGLYARNFNGQQFGANIAGAGQGVNRANGTGMAAGGFVSGEVVSQDSQSITIKLVARQNSTGQTGGSKIVFFSTSTQVMKTSEGSLSDIKIGENLTITGKANSDGSITAQSIQVRPNIPVK